MNRLDYMVQVEDLHASPKLRARIAALAGEAKRPRRRFKPWMGVCAAVAVVVLGGAWLVTNVRMGGNAGGGGHDEASTFMSYAGPVFPLTLGEANDSITAERNITLDFAPWERQWVSNEEEAAALEGVTEAERQEALEQYNEWFTDGGYYRSYDHILVTDSYTLNNDSDTDQEVTVYYPFASILEELSKYRPTLTVDGAELDTALTVGSAWSGYSAGSWEDYRTLFSGGDYLETALAPLRDPASIPVIVYEFTDPYGPAESEEAPNPSIRASMELNYDQTVVLSYGFQGGSFDREAGTMMQDFSIPEPEEADYGSTRCLVVLGEDVTGLTTEGYVSGSNDPDTPVLENSGVTVKRYESDLDTIFRTILADALARRMDTEDIMYTDLDFETCYRVILERFYQSGLPENLSEWTGTGCIEDFISESFTMDRVSWVSAQITVPAGGSVTVEASFAKAGSFDYACAHSKNRGVYGYDLVTKLGSNLACTSQTATLEDRGLITIVRQNFGFDLEKGVNTVTLDPAEEHYYLEVKRLTE